jgi:oligosaccharide repeat unit polymerase
MTYAFMYYRVGTIPILHGSEVNSVNETSGIPGLSYIRNLSWVAVSFSFVNYFVYSKRNIKYLQPVLMFIMILLVILEGKKWAITGLIIIIFFYLITFNKKHIKKAIAWLCLVIFAIFIGNFILRDLQDIYINNYYATGMIDVENKVFSPVIVYISNYVWKNFYIVGEAINIDINFAYGLNTFKFLVSPFLSSAEQTMLLKNIDLYQGNAVMYLGYYYLDFGFWGAIMTPFYIGLFSSFIYLKAHKNIIPYLIIYGFIVRNICLLFAQSTFSSPQFWFNIFFVFACTIVLKMKTGSYLNRQINAQPKNVN